MNNVKASRQNTPKDSTINQADGKDILPFISVMILNYNYGDLLGRALEACGLQTFQDFEVVMINNGAIDNTEEVYQRFCEKYPQIRTTYVFIEQNQGPMHGWNEGIKYAKGKYVMFNDADDWMEPDCLEKLAQKARETDADRITGQYRSVLADGSVIRERKFTGRRAIPTGMLQGVIFRRSIIVENDIYIPENGTNYVVGYDHWFVCRFAMFQGTRGAIVRHIIYNYFMNQKALSLMLARSDDEVLLDAEMSLFINCAAETIRAVTDDETRWEIEHLVIRVAYSRMLDKMRYLPPKNAKRFHNHTHETLKKALPNWRKNPLLWPFRNGYEFMESFGLYTYVQIDRLHGMWIIQLIERVSRVVKFRR